jgi:predicted dithiol-disulfide oxidoreductase (DUF899 family)
MTRPQIPFPPKVVSRQEWLAARRALLAKEKELTRAGDALTAQRRALPMVRIEKPYTFEAPSGRVTLLDLFEGRPQLFVYHFMFDPDWEKGCPSCTYFEDNRPPLHFFHDKGLSYALISRAPLAKLEAYKRERGWTTPWVSAFGSDFNYDFHVSLDESRAPVEYNYRTADEYAARGSPLPARGETPGVSIFLRQGEDVFHTYSAFARGVEPLVPTANFLDMTPLGRQDQSGI